MGSDTERGSDTQRGAVDTLRGAVDTERGSDTQRGAVDTDETHCNHTWVSLPQVTVIAIIYFD